MNTALGLIFGSGLALFAALPSTGNYKLHDYGFGSGGGDMGTSNYSLEGIAGEISSPTTATSNYGLKPGLIGSRLAALPDAPTWQNPDDWYNKLRLVINPTGNPGDATYAVAISTDNFATTQYVQSDSTIGPSLGLEDFRTLTGWGGAGGMNVIGLSPNTTYKVKVKARHGATTETGFGPEATAATAQVSVVFDIDIASTDTETNPPYILNFGSVNPDSVNDSPQRIWVDIESNAESGAFVYAVSDNSGLLSATTGHTINAVTGNLSAMQEGVGAQNTSVASSAGGPLNVPAPYNGSGHTTGAVDGQFRQILYSSNPLKNGRASFLLKIKTSGQTPAAPDYVDIYTMIATAAF